MFLPTKSAARNALEDFLPKSGRDYAAGRNYDHGPDGEASVSKLSPWIRNRMLPEWEVLAAVLEEKSAACASKYIDEVCWRTYWKGWLEMRPTVWQDYLSDRTCLLEAHEEHSGYKSATDGQTGIDGFDTWNSELVENNYLHNHARMWYSSIWVHTLKLPWQLGADWFLRHLIDGDPASNTLCWRWVAGLHTRGKTYLARPENIRKYTKGRFAVDASLAAEPIRIDGPPTPQPQALKSLEPIPTGQRLGLLVTEEDLSAIKWLGRETALVECAGFFPGAAYDELNISSNVVQFRREAMEQSELGLILRNIYEILTWTEENQLDGIVMAEPAVGPARDALSGLANLLESKGKSCSTARHWWDETLYPHATHGFFRFKKAIPTALDQIHQTVWEGIE